MAHGLLAGMLAHLLESSLAGAALLGLIWVCRHQSASLRRALGMVGLLKFLVPAAALAPVLALAGGLWEQWAPASARLVPMLVADWRRLAPAPDLSGVPGSASAWGVLAGWGVVTAILLLRGLVRASAFRRELALGVRTSPGRMARRLAALAPRVGGLASAASVVMTESEGPGIAGFRSPLVVVPHALAEVLGDDELDAILVHELVHLRRWDHRLAPARSVLLALFWPSPVVWLLCRSVALESERACDDDVVAITGRPRAYAAGILLAVRHAAGLLDPGLTGVARLSVSSRLESILGPRKRPEPPTGRALILAIGFALATLGAGAEAAAHAAAATSTPAAEEEFDLARLSVRPRLLAQARPVYPPDLHALGLGGRVVVDFVVSPAGAVLNPAATTAANPALGRAAVDAVRRWKFSAGQVKGRRVFVHMQVPIVFSAEAGERNARS